MMPTASIGKRLKLVALATRPWSFSMTVISVTLGNIAAVPPATFQWQPYLLVLLGMVLAHAGANVLNDYYDFRHGVDVAGSPTTRYRRHPLVEKDFTPAGLLSLSLGCYLLAALIGLSLLLTYGWPIAFFTLLGGLAGILYTAGPVKYKHRAMGEIAVFLIWGPVMMSAAHFIQTASWQHLDTVIWISIPQGLWVALVLLANNIKDIDYDQESTVTTLGTLLGRSHAMRLYTSLVAGIYLITLVEIFANIIPVWGLLTLLSLPGVINLILRFRREHVVPPDADPQTANTGMIYGVLLIAAFLLTRT
ncbi:1,4-dihydroxy-2-naphthoate prenyltransferase [candidate division KSB3 bacterium]|uniref:1,4-dihydroxy-2-naphthoate prenyltransferase n=1 Tax=candidate division KSB3 bacterium TaxID=2044937 RepID=A0A9D5JY91_9BACT|nr:1,4-dihydroxy-2-naphthoate prenyltransferase [candidate division KSB3 bacterium]MBD3326032.1 1,4-dihydroxy-2-naphthoate prenyltransferase [candidate division KSB3 bacterium]